MPINGNKNVGIFDSGLGGLNILRKIKTTLPDYNYVYLGDNARVPYGSRSSALIYEFTKQAVDFLFNKDCEIVILACNTASAQALRKIQQEHLPYNYPDRKVLGVIIPTVEYVLNKGKGERIGIVGTRRTIDSQTFIDEFKKLDPKINVFQVSCPLLVPLIEAGEDHLDAEDLILRKYLRPLFSEKIDSLVLGCTHYGTWKGRIERLAGKDIRVFTEEDIVPEKLKDYLSRHPEIEGKLSKEKRCVFYSTDPTSNFLNLGKRFFGERIDFQKADLF